MKKSILITGGSGLLAVNWALIAREQYSVTLGLHNRRVSMNGVTSLPIDMGSDGNLRDTISSINPDLVIHTAGLTNVEDCEARPDLAKYINVDLAGNVASVCNLLHIPLVHISTDHLFAGDTGMTYENHPVAPQNVYGRTKADAESRVLETHDQSLVIRTNFFGWGPSYRWSFSDNIIGALREKREVALFRDVYFTPILIEKLVHAVHELVDRKATGIFHVVGDERISKYKFGLKIAEQFHLNKDLIKMSNLSEQRDLVRRPLDMSLSNEKACHFLGRKLGDVKEHLERLLDQDELGIVREVRIL